MNELDEINNSIPSGQPTKLPGVIISSDCQLKDNINKRILIATIQYIKDSNRFDKALTQPAKKQHKKLYLAIGSSSG